MSKLEHNMKSILTSCYLFGNRQNKIPNSSVAHMLYTFMKIKKNTTCELYTLLRLLNMRWMTNVTAGPKIQWWINVKNIFHISNILVHTHMATPLPISICVLCAYVIICGFVFYNIRPVYTRRTSKWCVAFVLTFAKC